MTNSRFEDLERRCLKMKRARIAKVVLACVLVCMAIFTYIFMTQKVMLNRFSNTIGMSQNNMTSIVSEEKNVTAMPVEVNATVDENATKDVNHSKPIEESNETVQGAYDTLMLSAKIKKDSWSKTVPIEEKIVLAPPVKNENHEKIPEIEDFSMKPEQRKALSISVTSLSNEEALLKNFHSSKSFNEALALAHYYFDKKEYVKAISWSKESSKLKPISDEPWLLYAKSKFHLGDRAEAIRSLELFSGYVNSKDVKDLLLFYKGQQ